MRLSAETVRRGLHRMEFVWRRPRPVVGPKVPQYEAKLPQLQQLVAELQDEETVAFQDEVELHLNPKIGCQWMPRGEQVEVVRPGKKRSGTWPARYTGGRARCCPGRPARAATAHCS